MPEYQHYPLMMRHPGETPAVLGRSHGEGAPIRFPPVWVNSPEQEEEYKAKGYVSGGSNPQAFQASFSVPPTSYVPKEYPKWIGDTIVHDEDEEAEALERMTAPVEDKTPPDEDPYGSVDKIREKLIAKAEARGIKVDGRWSLERLIIAANSTEEIMA